MTDEEMQKIIEEGGKKEQSKSLEVVDTSKSINQVSVSDIKFKVDDNKSYEEQAEDIVGAMATAKAVNDENVQQDLANKKAEELLNKAELKRKQAEANNIKAETEKQKAERDLWEAVLGTFGITKHLPNWLMVTMVVMLTPFYLLLELVIGVPSGLVKILIDNIDNIIVRYDSAESNSKPKIKVTIWILLVLSVLGATALIVLKCLKII